MKRAMIACLSFFYLSGVILAGAASSKAVRQTNIPYEECLNKIYFGSDALYKASDTEVIERKNNKIILKNNSPLGESRYIAEEKQSITTEEGIFETKLVEKIAGTLHSQKTIIKVKSVGGKAHITIDMDAEVNHWLANSRAVKKQIDTNIKQMLDQIDK